MEVYILLYPYGSVYTIIFRWLNLIIVDLLTHPHWIYLGFTFQYITFKREYLHIAWCIPSDSKLRLQINTKVFKVYELVCWMKMVDGLWSKHKFIFTCYCSFKHYLMGTIVPVLQLPVGPWVFPHSTVTVLLPLKFTNTVLFQKLARDT